MNVGFTGTQQGMTDMQHKTVAIFLESVYSEGSEFHHGDCIGADVEAADIARGIGYTIVAHPANDVAEEKRGKFPGNDVIMPARPALARNDIIVKLVELIVAAPHEEQEALRSGTWATIRRARKQGKHIVTVWPNGFARTRTARL